MAGYLIDSHIFFWAIDAPERLLSSERTLLEASRQDIFVSVATFWELSVKFAKGHLPLGKGSAPIDDEYFARHARNSGFEILPIESPEAEYVRRMPRTHGDPFDRIIIAQAILGNRLVVTRDAKFSQYPGVRVFMA